MKSRLRVADAIRVCWDIYAREHSVPTHSAKAVHRMLRGRTSVADAICERLRQ